MLAWRDGEHQPIVADRPAARLTRDCDDLLDVGGQAWRMLTPEIIKSVCRCAYLERAQQT